MGEDYYGDVVVQVVRLDDYQDNNGTVYGYNVVVLQSMEDCDVAVNGDYRQVENGFKQGEDEQRVNDVIGCGFKIVTRFEIICVFEYDQDIFQDFIQVV